MTLKVVRQEVNLMLDLYFNYLEDNAGDYDLVMDYLSDCPWADECFDIIASLTKEPNFKLIPSECRIVRLQLITQIDLCWALITPEPTRTN